MKVLGIETSCDETAIAIVESGHQVHCNLVSSQISKHAMYGGVIPELAAREHLKAIDPITQQALKDVGMTMDDIDAVAVTQSPGLLPALLVGISYGKGLAMSHQKPFIGINHFLAHIFGAFIEEAEALKKSENFPVLSLIVSGGHTALMLIKADGACEIIGQTLDDAAGEAFDKAAKILNLPYPGGPVIDKRAKEGNPKAFDFPRGLCGGSGNPVKPENRLNFSFSGVKTSLLYQVRKDLNSDLDEVSEMPEDEMNDIIASYQEAVVDALTTKLFWAAEDSGAKSLVLCGGVACNSRLREKSIALAEKKNLPLFIAPPKYCTDNAAMIAGIAYYYLKEGDTSSFDADATPRLGQVKRIPFAM